jgi:ketosteroid isomerase-like protein
MDALAAIGAGDRDRLRLLSDRSFVAVPASSFLGGDGRPYSGRDGLARWVDDLTGRWASFSLSVIELRERRGRVYCEAEMVVVAKRVASPVRHELHLVLETRRGKITSIRSYGKDRGAALGAWQGAAPTSA